MINNCYKTSIDQWKNWLTADNYLSVAFIAEAIFNIVWYIFLLRYEEYTLLSLSFLLVTLLDNFHNQTINFCALDYKIFSIIHKILIHKTFMWAKKTKQKQNHIKCIYRPTSNITEDDLNFNTLFALVS